MQLISFNQEFKKHMMFSKKSQRVFKDEQILKNTLHLKLISICQ